MIQIASFLFTTKQVLVKMERTNANKGKQRIARRWAPLDLGHHSDGAACCPTEERKVYSRVRQRANGEVEALDCGCLPCHIPRVHPASQSLHTRFDAPLTPFDYSSTLACSQTPCLHYAQW